jgi:hypothetical protein
MTKRTRYFLAGSVGFLVVTLAVGVVAYYGGVPGFAEPAGPTELSFVPSDAAVVAYADVKSLMTSQFRQQMKALEPVDRQEGRDEIKNTVGIDIEQDIDYVVACVLAAPAAGADVGTAAAPNGYILAHGRFDQARIEAFIREKGGVEQVYREKKMFVHPQEATADGTVANRPEMGVTFINASVVALGATAALKKAIDIQHADAQTVTSNAEVMKMIGTVEPGNNAWVVGRFDVLSQQAHLPSEVTGRLPQVTWFSAGGHVNGGVNGTVSLTARDPEAAKNLQAVIGGFVALANMQAASRPELQAIMKGVALSNDNNTVTMSFTVPSTMIEALKAAHVDGLAPHPPEPPQPPKPPQQPK